MQIIQGLFDFIRHFVAQDAVIREYGTQIYLILFLIVFVETGLVVMPFLPGDSLLFAAGALAASGTLEIGWLLPILVLAALTGDNVNYAIGKFLGPRLLKSEKSRFLNRKHLDRTHAYFDKYGGKTIIMARFIPIVRTFTPFVAGIGAMTYPRFLAYSVAGALLWVGSCTTLGYFFGGLSIVKKNFELVVIAIVLISVLPAFFEYLKHRRQRVDAVASEPAGE
jgi:membrane-associated protein